MPGPLRCTISPGTVSPCGPWACERCNAGPFASQPVALKEGMRKLILLIALLPGVAIVSLLAIVSLAIVSAATVGVALANDLPKKGQPKPKPPQATANPCAQYGAGFVQVPGSQTCVKTQGYIRTDVTTSGRAR